jgi:hypothetical protein
MYSQCDPSRGSDVREKPPLYPSAPIGTHDATCGLLIDNVIGSFLSLVDGKIGIRHILPSLSVSDCTHADPTRLRVTRLMGRFYSARFCFSWKTVEEGT